MKSEMMKTVNRSRHTLTTLITLVAMAALWGGQARAAEDWFWQGSGQLLLKGYGGSTELDVLFGAGGFVAADYLEQGGVKFGYQVNRTVYQTGAGRLRDHVDQQLLYASGSLHRFPDYLPGRISYRLDAYVGHDERYFETITSTSGMGGGSSRLRYTEQDNYWALNPIIAFLNYRKTFYADLGYAFSQYHSTESGEDDIEVSQWTPTLGLGFNRGYDWLQLRGYYIDLSRSNRLADLRDTAALQLGWTHWFGSDAPLGLHSLQLTGLAGERIYAVDSDAGALANVPDRQTGLLTLGAQWQSGEKNTVMLQAGYESYHSGLLDDRYQSIYVYASIARRW